MQLHRTACKISSDGVYVRTAADFACKIASLQNFAVSEGRGEILQGDTVKGDGIPLYNALHIYSFAFSAFWMAAWCRSQTLLLEWPRLLVKWMQWWPSKLLLVMEPEPWGMQFMLAA